MEHVQLKWSNPENSPILVSKTNVLIGIIRKLFIHGSILFRGHSSVFEDGE